MTRITSRGMVVLPCQCLCVCFRSAGAVSVSAASGVLKLRPFGRQVERWGAQGILSPLQGPRHQLG